MQKLLFSFPETGQEKIRIRPVFLSFRGCPVRCVFCAQTLQSGKGESSFPNLLEGLRAELETASQPAELAFYGGTFTMLPEKEQLAFLELAACFKKRGTVTRVRASTRPDAFDLAHLRRLKDAGLDLLELGVQSFADNALAASTRGYDGSAALTGCESVRESGLALGIQLMPGMPGMREEDFLPDVEQALALLPETLRLYPCLVLSGTQLAALFRQGRFTPWPLERIVPLLVQAQLRAWEQGVRIIRMGLAPQAELQDGGILAGPEHPALGSIVRGKAFFHFLFDRLKALPGQIVSLSLPRKLQGEFWGHRGELKEPYTRLGIHARNVSWKNDSLCEIVYLPQATTDKILCKSRPTR